MKKLVFDYIPTGSALLRTLIELYAEQEGIKVTFEREEVHNGRA